MALHVNVYGLGAQGVGNAIADGRGRALNASWGNGRRKWKGRGRGDEDPAFTNHEAFPAKDEIVS